MAEQDPTADITARARIASRKIAEADTGAKNAALRALARLLVERTGEIERANRADLRAAEQRGLPRAVLGRLIFDRSGIESRIRSLEKIAALPDPVGQPFGFRKLPNGLTAGRVRVPLGVILMVYEARPHVTVNAGAFALKSGNAIICKGGSEAARCNALLARLWTLALEAAGLNADAVQVVVLTHAQVEELIARPGTIDLVIPRGSRELVRAVCEKSRVPVIKHFEGICHVYLEKSADRDRARRIALDSKVLMPGVCNAAETLLVDRELVGWLPELAAALGKHGVEIRGCPQTLRALPRATPGGEQDWRTEHLAPVYSVRVVSGFEQATEHIARYGSGHTDAIVTEDYAIARRFLETVDSAVVLVNASTMFCDGETLGMGAEIGISTDRLHARGPMGLEELTTYKHVILGDGQVMGDF